MLAYSARSATTRSRERTRTNHRHSGLVTPNDGKCNPAGWLPTRPDNLSHQENVGFGYGMLAEVGEPVFIRCANWLMELTPILLNTSCIEFPDLSRLWT